MSLQGDVTKEYLQKYPDAATRTLARMIFRDNPEIFNTYEAARSNIRFYRGATGEKKRKSLTDKTYLREHRTGKDTFPKLPEGLTSLKGWDTYKLTGEHKILVLSDAHIPYHDKTALEIAVKKGKDFNADIVLLNGDYQDHFSISRWEKDPREKNFPQERKIVLQSFEWLRAHFPKARIIYKIGNHEERYERYMEIKAPELLGIPNFDFDKVFELDNYGIELVGDMKPIKANNLFIIHGHEYRFSISNPVNPARGLYLRTKENAMCGHFHQPSSHSENNIEDEFTTCWSVGCLCEMHPKYMPLNKWSHGFALIETSGKKHFQVHNYKIINGEIYAS